MPRVATLAHRDFTVIEFGARAMSLEGNSTVPISEETAENFTELVVEHELDGLAETID